MLTIIMNLQWKLVNCHKLFFTDWSNHERKLSENFMYFLCWKTQTNLLRKIFLLHEKQSIFSQVPNLQHPLKWNKMLHKLSSLTWFVCFPETWSMHNSSQYPWIGSWFYKIQMHSHKENSEQVHSFCTFVTKRDVALLISEDWQSNFITFSEKKIYTDLRSHSGFNWSNLLYNLVLMKCNEVKVHGGNLSETLHLNTTRGVFNKQCELMPRWKGNWERTGVGARLLLNSYHRWNWNPNGRLLWDLPCPSPPNFKRKAMFNNEKILWLSYKITEQLLRIIYTVQYTDLALSIKSTK